MEFEKVNALREVRKLCHVLDTFGNVLVPSLEGQSETSAMARLIHFLEILQSQFGIETQEQLNKELDLLEQSFPAN